MKKLKLVGILAAVVLIGGVISIPLINNYTAYKVEKELCEISATRGSRIDRVVVTGREADGERKWDAVFRSNPNSGVNCLWKNWMLTIQITEVMNGSI